MIVFMFEKNVMVRSIERVNMMIFMILIEWYYGSLANKPHQSGIFPKNFVYLKPVIVDNNQYSMILFRWIRRKAVVLLFNRVINFVNEDHLASDLIGILREWGKDFEMRNIRIYLFDFQLIISNNFIKFVFVFFLWK